MMMRIEHVQDLLTMSSLVDEQNIVEHNIPSLTILDWADSITQKEEYNYLRYDTRLNSLYIGEEEE